MRTITWTTTHRIVRENAPIELPERFRTGRGYQMVRLPDILRVNGRLCISKRLMDGMRRRIARRMNERINEMARNAFLGGAK